MRQWFAGIAAAACVWCAAMPVKAENAQNSEYTIGAEDVLEIAVLKPEKLNNTVTVSPDGTIAFPYIGNVVVRGKTLKGAQDLIERKLSDGYMNYPLVSVSLKETRSRKFSVSGDVVKPGTYPIEGNTTVFKAISTAGGFIKPGPSNDVQIVRQKKNQGGYETIKVNMQDLKGGGNSKNMLIRPDDVIEVAGGKFSVYGEVVKPGTYSLDGNTTVLKAISMAEGFTKYGSSGHVKILRPKAEAAGYEDIKVDIDALMKDASKGDVLLLPGDIVVVNKGVF